MQKDPHLGSQKGLCLLTSLAFGSLDYSVLRFSGQVFQLLTALNARSLHKSLILTSTVKMVSPGISTLLVSPARLSDIKTRFDYSAVLYGLFSRYNTVLVTTELKLSKNQSYCKLYMRSGTIQQNLKLMTA